MKGLIRIIYNKIILIVLHGMGQDQIDKEVRDVRFEVNLHTNILEFWFRGQARICCILSSVVLNALLFCYSKLILDFGSAFALNNELSLPFICYIRILTTIVSFLTFFLFTIQLNHICCCLPSITFLPSSSIIRFKPLTFYSQCKLLMIELKPLCYL